MEGYHPGTADKSQLTHIKDQVAGTVPVHFLGFIDLALIIGPVQFTFQMQDGDAGGLIGF